MQSGVPHHEPGIQLDHGDFLDGCIDYADPDNLGLQGCLLDAIQETGPMNVILESMWQDWCTEVSVTDSL